MVNGIYQERKFVRVCMYDCPLKMTYHKSGDKMDAHVAMIKAMVLREIDENLLRSNSARKYTPVNPAKIKVRSINRKFVFATATSP